MTVSGGLRLGAAALLAFAALAVASYVFTQTTYCGNFTQARYEISFLDENGLPLRGVTMEVAGATRPTHVEPRGGWPVFEYEGEPLAADDQGVLAFHQVEPVWAGFCYRGWRLFWIFPVSDGPPAVSCRFRKDGFATRSIDFREIDQRLSGALADGHGVAKGPGGVDYVVGSFKVLLKRAG